MGRYMGLGLLLAVVLIVLLVGGSLDLWLNAQQKHWGELQTVVFFILVVAGVLVALMLIGPSVGDPFSTINSSLAGV